MPEGTENLSAARPSPTIAIVGSGPSGCYLAQFSRKRWPDAEIVIFDRQPLPYGLVRYGVAPDHPGTKAVTKQFDRLFERENVRFVGGVEVGGDLSLAQLRDAFDVVVLATGLSADRALSAPVQATASRDRSIVEPGADTEAPSASRDFPGAELAGVYGSGRITRLINGHPDEHVTGLSLGARITIVGQGNVSMDLLRLILTAPERLRELGVADDVIAVIEAGRVRHIDVVGRSAPARAKFDPAMVRELGKIANVRFIATTARADDFAEASADAEGLAKQQAMAALVASTDAALTEDSRTVHFHFGWSPELILGTDAVTGIVFVSDDATGPRLTLRSQAILTAIGFIESGAAPVRRGTHETVASDLARGYLDDGLYCVGWLRRGPQGTIPANRVDAKMVTDVIAAAVESGELRTGKPGYAGLASPEPLAAGAEPLVALA